MNRSYRIVWNATINRWVVASEVAKGRKKKTGRGEQVATGAAVMFAATLMLGTGVPLSAQAQVQGWSVAECYLFPSLYPRL
ncbi:ESPR domain-containing protein, partial [Bacillus sp. SIMBA_008]|uniref:ESPR domain-containing protein n=1 Tax=Bacillus sp. SIMBA_008 TaxID=3085757 RepID=UPI00397E801F